jgi:predicted transcriptional regulator
MDEHKIIELLTVNGMSKNVSILLMELKNVNGQGLTQTDLISRTGLNQPAISIATAQAYRDGYLKPTICKKDRNVGRGSPFFYRYTLARPFPEIINTFINERSQELSKMMMDLQRLQEVA